MNMMRNCDGCQEDLQLAYEYQKKGLHLATDPFADDYHWYILMVNNKGEIVVE